VEQEDWGILWLESYCQNVGIARHVMLAVPPLTRVAKNSGDGQLKELAGITHRLQIATQRAGFPASGGAVTGITWQAHSSQCIAEDLPHRI